MVDTSAPCQKTKSFVQPCLLKADHYLPHRGSCSLMTIVSNLIYLQAQAQAKGSSLMQPLLPVSKPQGPSTAQIGSDAFAAMAESDVAPDAQFFHKYYR